MSDKKFFYGYINVILCFLIFMFTSGVAQGTVSLYIHPITEDLGFSRASFSAIISITGIFMAVFSFLFGLVTRKIGLKEMIILGCIFISLGYGLFCISNNLYVFYVLAGLVGIGSAFCTNTPLSAIITNWFIEKKGFYLGLMLASSGIGGFIFNPVIGGMIVKYGWRKTILFEAIMIAAVALIAAILLAPRPEDKGTVALGTQKVVADRDRNAEIVMQGHTFKEVLKTGSYKLLILAILVQAIGIQAMNYTIAPNLVDKGFTPVIASTVMSVVYAFMAIFKIVLGMVNDRFGLKMTLLIGYASSVVAAVSFILVNSSLGLAYVGGAFYGIAMVMMSVPLPLFVAELYGQKEFGAIMGPLMTAIAAGIAIGVPVINVFYEIYHNYVFAYIIEIVCAVASFAMAILALKMKPGASHP
ncbi:Sugar phosphate permease [Desulfitobacterium sp. LBE]|uniref:MFS transporter n=1 Tax=Desulfitobacterium sp. LBE TaxID=884086 RepID=UPI00119C8895|nr:MFS transporter [Desulfitobacterium sp. LBE]TWH56903.1 Sugar phosphate permease [Desulfitobacterium sp. LBE]